jgi:hypothetical protein
VTCHLTSNLFPLENVQNDPKPPKTSPEILEGCFSKKSKRHLLFQISWKPGVVEIQELVEVRIEIIGNVHNDSDILRMHT